MWGVIAFLSGVGFGVVSTLMLVAIGRDGDRLPRPELPAATPRAIARYRREQRADIRAALLRADIERRIPPALDHFDNEAIR